jgi:hypothetical protein
MHDLSYVHSFFQLCQPQPVTHLQPHLHETPHPEKPGKEKKETVEISARNTQTEMYTNDRVYLSL